MICFDTVSSAAQSVSEAVKTGTDSGILGLIFGGLLIVAGIAYFITLAIVAKRKKDAGDYTLAQQPDDGEKEEEDNE